MAKTQKKTSNIKAKSGNPSAVPAAERQTAKDDTEITALSLQRGKLSPAMEGYFGKCAEKLGFVPNVLQAYAFDNAKLEAFVGMYNDLMLAPSGLSKLEREMIAVAVSSVNRCYYCLVAHGAAVFANALAGRFGKDGLHVTNVNAHDLGVMGVEKSTGMPRRHIMIRRNTPLPAESSTRFQAHRQAKQSGAIRIVEGGDDSGNGSTAIGHCVVTDLPTDPNADRTILVMFHYAPNGCLSVTAQTAGGKPAILILERAAGMPEDQLAAWTERVSGGLVPINVLDDDEEPETELEPIEDDPPAADTMEELPEDDNTGNPFDFKGH